MNDELVGMWQAELTHTLLQWTAVRGTQHKNPQNVLKAAVPHRVPKCRRLCC